VALTSGSPFSEIIFPLIVCPIEIKLINKNPIARSSLIV